MGAALRITEQGTMKNQADAPCQILTFSVGGCIIYLSNFIASEVPVKQLRIIFKCCTIALLLGSFFSLFLNFTVTHQSFLYHNQNNTPIRVGEKGTRVQNYFCDIIERNDIYGMLFLVLLFVSLVLCILSLHKRLAVLDKIYFTLPAILGLIFACISNRNLATYIIISREDVTSHVKTTIETKGNINAAIWLLVFAIISMLLPLYIKRLQSYTTLPDAPDHGSLYYQAPTAEDTDAEEVVDAAEPRTDEPVGAKIASAAASSAQSAATQEKIFCPLCGILSDGEDRCINCGMELSLIRRHVERFKPKTYACCPKCGTAAGGNAFCGRCGTTLTIR